MSDFDKPNQDHLNHFDFETWAKLYKEDPEAFEQKRSKWVKMLIDTAPDHAQQRLRGLQFQVDSIRKTAKNPYMVTIKISKMMMDKLRECQNAINELREAIEGKYKKPKSLEKATLLHFRKKETVPSEEA